MAITTFPPPASPNYFLDLSRGLVSGQSAAGITIASGEIPVDGSFHRPWPLNGVAGAPAHTFLPSTQTIDISSTDVNDYTGSTGLQTGILTGLDGSGVLQTELVTLNGGADGQDATPTSNTWSAINSWTSVLVGSTGINEGTIYFGTGTVDANGVNDTPHAVIAPGAGTFQQGTYTTPTAAEVFFAGAVICATEPMLVRLKIQIFTEAINTVFESCVYPSSPLKVDPEVGQLGPGASNLFIEAKALTNPGEIYGLANIVLVE